MTGLCMTSLMSARNAARKCSRANTMNLLPMNNPRTVNLGENIAYINKKLKELESMGEQQTEGNWSGEYCYTIFRSGTCSNCGERAPTRNYCCYCGAKMRSAYHNPKTEKIMEEIEDK